MPRHTNRHGFVPTNFIHINVFGPRELRQRMAVAKAEDGYTSYWEMLWDMLDKREAERAKRLRAQPSPLHPPRPGHGVEGVDPMAVR